MTKAILTLLILIMLSSNTYEQVKRTSVVEELHTVKQGWSEIRIQKIKNSNFSLELLEELLTLYNVQYSDYIIRQAVLETGNFTSTIFMENNNLLGMKHPRVRSTTSIGSNRGHAKYSHWTDSVIDYLLWLRYYKDRGYNTENYFRFLREVGYAEDPLYIYKLQNLNFV